MLVKYDGDDPQESAIIYINPKLDIWEYSLPLTHDTADQTKNFKSIAAESLAIKILRDIEPEYIEMTGYELMHYRLAVKKYKD